MASVNSIRITHTHAYSYILTQICTYTHTRTHTQICTYKHTRSTWKVCTDEYLNNILLEYLIRLFFFRWAASPLEMNLNILRLHSYGKQRIIISAFLFCFFFLLSWFNLLTILPKVFWVWYVRWILADSGPLNAILLCSNATQYSRSMK